MCKKDPVLGASPLVRRNEMEPKNIDAKILLRWFTNGTPYNQKTTLQMFS